jgi:hypothetical protein
MKVLTLTIGGHCYHRKKQLNCSCYRPNKILEQLHCSRYMYSQKIVPVTSFPLLVLPKNFNKYIIPVTCPPNKIEMVSSVCYIKMVGFYKNSLINSCVVRNFCVALAIYCSYQTFQNILNLFFVSLNFPK